MNEKIPGEPIQGAEAIVEIYYDSVIKKRITKSYRLRELDDKIRAKRTRMEAKMISEARKGGVPTPIIYDISDYEIAMELIKGDSLKHVLNDKLCMDVGEMVGKLHNNGIVHSDLTTSNMILSGGKIYLIDFGLSYFDKSVEARGVDIHLLFQTFKSTHDEEERLREAFEVGYKRLFPKASEVLKRVIEIEQRGRYL
ncbi:MAG: Kae1-associated kinase Bud32 [Halobacteriota archaeon]|nr:Kae1-associated kinase Bud32 [Halobacteriota archaeon]